MLSMALEQEQLWRKRLLHFGIAVIDEKSHYRVEGIRPAQTDEEKSARNRTHASWRSWYTMVIAGQMYILRKWAIEQATALHRPGAGARRAPWVALTHWLPGPSELSTELFDILVDAQQKAIRDTQTIVVKSIPKEREAEAATYITAGLVRSCLVPNIGERRRAALAFLSGDNSKGIQKDQLLQELPGATFEALRIRTLGESADKLRNQVAELID